MELKEGQVVWMTKQVQSLNPTEYESLRPYLDVLYNAIEQARVKPPVMSQVFIPSTPIDSNNPPYAKLRKMLEDTFDADSLKLFCKDRETLRPVCSRFGDRSISGMADEVLEYCRTRLLWDYLVDEVATYLNRTPGTSFVFEQKYNISQIKAMLLAGFSAEDLRRLLYYAPDFRLRDIVKGLGNDGLVQVVDKAIDAVVRGDFVDSLLVEVKRANPRQYAKYEPFLMR